MEIINETKSSFLEKFNKTEKSPAKLTRKKKREDHLAILGIKKEYHYRSCKLKYDSNNFTQVFLTTYEMN